MGDKSQTFQQMEFDDGMVHPTRTEERDAITWIKQHNCPLCCPELLDQPRLHWGHYRNCAEHNQEVDMVRQKLTEQVALRPQHDAPQSLQDEAETASEQQSDVAPVRSIVERFRDAAQLLRERRVTFTTEQEQRFQDKWSELCDAYEAEHPGKQTPGLRYDANAYLEPVWPPNFWKSKA